MSSGAPEGLATPAPLVAPVVLLSSQSRDIVTIDVGHNRYRNGFVFMTVGRYPLSSVKWIFRTGQPNHDGDRKISGVMTVIFPLETLGSVAFWSAATLYQ